jgi:hypothetical protein
MLQELQDRLNAEHAPFLERLLESKNGDTVTLAAEHLHRLTGSRAGVRPLVARLEAARGPSAGERSPSHERFLEDHALRALATIGGDEAVTSLVRFATEGPAMARRDAIDAAAGARDTRLADALAALLEDRESTRACSAWEIRVCDAAARSLAAMVGYDEKSLDGSSDAGKRDASYAALAAWWAERRAAFDWEARRAGGAK